MKKTIAVAVFLFVVAETGIFAQTIVSPSVFATYYGFKNGKVTPDTDNEYYWATDYNDHSKFGAYEDEDYAIDTAKEWFLTMACGTSQIKVTDASMARKIEAVLPSNDREKRDLQAGFVVYQDIVIARFLGNTSAASKYDGWLKFITDRKNVTRAEIEKYYRDGIRGLIAGIVDEEFNKISFLLQGSPNGSYNAVLTREGNRCVLNYEGYFDSSKQTKTLTASSLDALVSEMRNNRVDFNADAIRNFQEQAKLIPAVSSIGKRNTEPVALLTNILVGLYSVATTQEKEYYYKAMIGLYIHFQQLVNAGEGIKATPATYALTHSINEMSPELFNKFGRDLRQVDVFSTRFTSSSRDDIEYLTSWR